MAQTASPQEVRPVSWRAILIGAGIAVAVLLAVFIGVRISQANDRAQQADEYYCTLSGVDSLDRGPETGDLCADVLSR